MTTGVLMYCFDTPEVNYHLLAERCVAQIRKYLKLEITIVTNFETFEKSWVDLMDSVVERYGSWETRKGYERWHLLIIK